MAERDGLSEELDVNDDDDDNWGAMVNGAKEDEPAGTAPPSLPPAGVDDARGGTENAPKRPPPGASSRFPWTKRCWAYPPHVLRCASLCRRSRSTLALKSGRRRCSVLDERYREDMPRARRRVTGGSPLGWGRSPTFAAVAGTTEAVAAGWAGGLGIIAIDTMSVHTALVYGGTSHIVCAPDM